MHLRPLVAASLLLLAASTRGEELKNWFDDPFFQVRAGIASCPTPRGPLISESDMRKQAHARAERGTTCWLRRECERANAYHYDGAIAEAVRRRFGQSAALAQASLWVTVSRRIVWVEGCASDVRAGAQVRRLLRGVPDVEQVIVNATADPRVVPYQVLPH